MATQMLDVGVAVPIVAARLAHARASTTLNVYAHAVPGDRHAAQQLSRRLAEVMPAASVNLKAYSAQSDTAADR
jgi:integrase